MKQKQLMWMQRTCSATLVRELELATSSLPSVHMLSSLGLQACCVGNGPQLIVIQQSEHRTWSWDPQSWICCWINAAHRSIIYLPLFSCCRKGAVRLSCLNYCDPLYALGALHNGLFCKMVVKEQTTSVSFCLVKCLAQMKVSTTFDVSLDVSTFVPCISATVCSLSF